MGFFKSLFGIALAGTAAYGAIKVTKKYQENKAIEQMAATPDDPHTSKSASEVIGDIAKATTEVMQETGEFIMDTAYEIKDKLNGYSYDETFCCGCQAGDCSEDECSCEEDAACECAASEEGCDCGCAEKAEPAADTCSCGCTEAPKTEEAETKTEECPCKETAEDSTKAE